MQVTGGIDAFRDDVTPGTGVASAVSALQEVGLASQTGELRVGEFRGCRPTEAISEGCSLQRAEVAGCRQVQWRFGWAKAPARAVICVA